MTGLERVRPLVSDLTRDGKGKILGSVAVGWFLSFGVRLIFPALLPFIRDAFDLTVAMAGLLITLLWLGYGLGQLPGGMLGDRVGARTVLVASTLASAGTMTLVSLSPNVVLLFAGAVLFGLGTAPYGPMRLVVLSTTFPERDGTAIGLTFAAGNLGTSTLPILATVLAAAVTWHVGFAFSIPLFLVAAAGLWAYVPADAGGTSTGSDITSPSFLADVLRTSASPGILLAGAVSMTAGFAYQGLTGLFPTYLVDVKGFSPTVAATFLGLLFVAGMAYQTASGVVADRYGTGPTLVAIFAVVVCGFVALPFVDGLVGVGVLTLALSCMLGYQPVVQTYLAAAFPDAMKGSGLGLLRTIAFMIGATGPVVVGVFAERGFFDQAFFGLGAVSAIALALGVGISWWTGRRG